jgi:AraC-like DNA-binding protein
MDLLTDILQHAGLRRRVLNLRHLQDRQALRFPCHKSIGFHVVLQGQAHVHAPGLKQPLALHAGDLVLMARGIDHVLSSGPDLPPGPIELAHTSTTPDAPDSTGPTRLIGGASQFWHDPLHPLFAELPDWTALQADTLPRLGPLSLTVALLAAEAAEPALGSQSVLHGLLDASFTYLLRELVAQRGETGSGWCHAVREPRVRQAVVLMHEDAARDWTLDELAQRVGLSRTALAQKFRLAMGDTPLNYLRTVRMQKAMHLLSHTDHTLDTVAGEVGYQDAFSFSKVFKRTVGLAPRDFRRIDADQKGLPGRL